MTPQQFDELKKTYLENWPAGLAALSLKQIRIPLTLDEVRTLGQMNRLKPHWFVGDTVSLNRVLEKMEQAIRSMAIGAFVRLGSRSSKDSYHAISRGMYVTTAAFALELLTSKSERMAFDLFFALRYQYQPSLFVREWRHIPAWAEFRCFVKKRQLVGISQYDCNNLGFCPQIHNNRINIETALREYFLQMDRYCHLEDYVYDVFLRCDDDHLMTSIQVVLLELNPFGDNTDFCLFDRNNFTDLDGGFRYIQSI